MEKQICPSVNQLCTLLNESAVRAEENVSSLAARKHAVLQQLKQEHPNTPGFVPSGPRKRGEGCDDELQGILEAQETSSGGARLRITLLAAGFIIGPGGNSVRSVSQSTGADIRSWSETSSILGRQRRVRCIVIEGPKIAVCEALACLYDAVERYKELCEGKYCGQTVDRIQRIRGVDFYYSPPPRSAVPYAAALKPDSSSVCYSGKENSVLHTSSRPCHATKMRSAASSGYQFWPISPSLETKPDVAVDVTAMHSMEGIDGKRTSDENIPSLSTQSQATSWALPSMFANTVSNNEAKDSLVSINDDVLGLFSSPPCSSQTEAWGAIGTDPGVYHSVVPMPTAPITPAINTSASSNEEGFINEQEYTLFGGRECRVGPRLLRDLWEVNESQISPAISGWRGNPAVGVPDRTLGLLALPSYLEFAEKSPFYNAPLESTAAVGDTPTYPKASEELGQGDHVTDFEIFSSQYDTDMQDHTE